jgi:NDP-sugar pyrophosphorylase family protein
MVLAAGLGLRLRPLTVTTAKPALPILGRPLLDYVLSVLQRGGVRDVVVNLHHHPESIHRILSHVAENDLRIHYSHEPEILGTAGGLKQAEAQLGEGTFFLVNGDTLVDIDLTELYGWHREKKAEATLLLRPKPMGSDYTGIGLDPQGRLELIEKRESDALMFAGVWVLEPSVLDRLPVAGRPGRLELELLPHLVREKKAFGFVRDMAWFDIGTPKRYLRACLSVARRNILRSLWRAEPIQTAEGQAPDTLVLAGPGTSIAASAHFSGDTVLGADCRVESKATVGSSVLWDRVTVGEGSLVRNSVVAEGVSLAEGSRIQNKVVMNLDGTNRRCLGLREITNGHVIAEIE